MRTIRTKVYQFSELSEQAKTFAAETMAREMIGLHIMATVPSDSPIITEMKKALEVSKYEFKADGTRF
jgi:hypothetical protein